MTLLKKPVHLILKLFSIRTLVRAGGERPTWSQAKITQSEAVGDRSDMQVKEKQPGGNGGWRG